MAAVTSGETWVEMQTLSDQRKERPDGIIGLNYRITNKNGISSYLVSTIHAVDRELNENPIFHQIIDKCKHLYTECGTQALDLKWNSGPFAGTEYCYILDKTITQMAHDKDMPISALDREELIEDLKKESLLSKMAALYQEGEKTLKPEVLKLVTYVNQLVKNKDGLKTEQFAELFRNAMKDGLGRLDSKILLYDRELCWNKTLIPVLNETKEPVCVAVGMAHVPYLRETFFKEDELTVKLITATFDLD